MAYKTSNRMQKMLLPTTIDDYVASDDPVRVYDAFVDALDIDSMGISLMPNPGADAYYPKDLLKLLIYSYSYGIRSSRKIERACYHNVSFQWLMGGLKPDYRTIARFRSEHKEALKKLLKQCVRMCIQMNFIEGNVLFIDGSKFRANASINQTYTKARAEKNIKKIEEHIDHLIEDSEQIDSQEDQESSMIKLRKQIHQKTEMVNKMKDVLKELNTKGKSSINITDTDSVQAKSRQGTHASYNVQNTVDGKHGLIVNTDAVSQHDDSNQLSAQIQQATEVLERKPETVVADSRYSGVDDVKEVDTDINVVVPSLKQAQEEKGAHPIKAFDKKYFVYDPSADQYICPQGKRLSFRSLSRQKDRVYQAKGSECRACPHFSFNRKESCTSSCSGRRIYRHRHEKFKERMEANYLKPENQIIYKQRKEKVEHPFGHMKRNLGAGQFMLRGKAKVDGEAAVLATCFNLRRIMTIIGTEKLITHFSGI